MALVVTLPLLEVYARGILSPLLFLVCSEGLSALLKKAGEQGTLKGVAACTSGPKISHLFFWLMMVLSFVDPQKRNVLR